MKRSRPATELESIDLNGFTLVALQLPNETNRATGSSTRPVDAFVKVTGERCVTIVFRSGVHDDLDWGSSLASRGVEKELSRGPCSGDLRGMEFVRLRFRNEPSAKEFCSLPPVPPASSGDGHLFGMRSWLAAHERAASADQRELQADADRALAVLDSREAASAKAVGDLATRMDADGFTLVTRGVKPRPALTSLESASAAVSAPLESDNAKRKRKRGDIAKPDFYAFQTREDKAGRLTQLRQQFDEDRERVRKLKAAHSFKPF